MTIVSTQQRCPIQRALIVGIIVTAGLIAGCGSQQSARTITTDSVRSTPSGDLRICSGTRVSNAPQHRQGKVVGYNPLVIVNGIALHRAPTTNACLSSGYGNRNGRKHKGIDLQQRPGGTIFAAANGTVIEIQYRNDFGKMILLDHGRGVYTRYAHLAGFDRNMAVGVPVNRGMPLGLMGDTGNATAVHLHYEILMGDYNNPRRSFGLQAINPLRF